MKRLFGVLASSLFLLTVAAPVMAQEKNQENFRQGEVVTVAKGEVLNRDLFAFGERVEISGTVNGDVYAFGGTIIVDGIINGDLIAAGGSLNISGVVSQDSRVAGGQITITGKIGRNLTIGAGNVEITDSANIGGSLLAGAGNLNIAGPIEKDIRAGSGSLTISSAVGGDVDAGVDTLRLTSKASVGGNLTYWSDQEASIDGNAKVQGEIVKNTPPKTQGPTPEKIFGVAIGAVLFLKIISFITTLVLGLLIIRLLPKFSQNVATNIRKKPWASLGVGFLATVLIPIVFVILLVTVIGIPLAIMLLPIYLISLYVVRVFPMLWGGVILSEKLNWKINAYWSFIAGSFIYFIIQLIPIVGGLVTLFTVLFGLGTLLITKKETYTAARKSSII